VCCYTDIVRTGRSSITLSIEVWAMRQGQGERLKVTDATFTFVAVDDNGRPRPLPATHSTSFPAR
jgi:acyl-CoA thioesterase YciA